MVTVKFFAGFREKVGKEEINIEIGDTSLESLIDLLDERHPGIKELIASKGSTIAVNRRVATLNDTVKDSDEVAIFPPVSGGSGKRDFKDSKIITFYLPVKRVELKSFEVGKL